MTLTRSTLPQRSPMPLMVPWTCVAPCADGGQGVGDGQVAVVVGVDADGHGRRLARPPRRPRRSRSGRLPPLVSQRTSQPAPAVGGGLERLAGRSRGSA